MSNSSFILIVEQKTGFETFAHFSYVEISGYLQVNLQIADTQSKEKTLIRLFADTYENLLDVKKYAVN